VLGVVPARTQLRRDLDEPAHFALRFLGPRAQEEGDKEDEDLAIYVVEPGVKRVSIADERLLRAVVTPRRLLALVDSTLHVGPVGGPLTKLLALEGKASFDATDDADAGSPRPAATWVLFSDRSGLRLGRVDKGGQGDTLAALTLLTSVQALSPRLVRLSTGALAAAWVQRDGERNRASLWLAWINPAGKLRGVPQRIDQEVTAADYANVAVVENGPAIELAWAPPLVGVRPAKPGEVTLEVRAFHASSKGASVTSWPRERVQAGTWNISGSAGGMLPIQLQAVRVGDTVAFLWNEMLGDDKWRLRAVCPGSGAVTLGDESLGDESLLLLVARYHDKGTWLYGAEDGALRRARLRCEGAI